MKEYLPSEVINIAFGVASTAFQLINTSSVSRKFLFVASARCCVRRGPASVAAATTSDWEMFSQSSVIYWLNPGEGVRVIRSAGDGVLQIGSVDS